MLSAGDQRRHSARTFDESHFDRERRREARWWRDVTVNIRLHLYAHCSWTTTFNVTSSSNSSTSVWRWRGAFNCRWMLPVSGYCFGARHVGLSVGLWSVRRSVRQSGPTYFILKTKMFHSGRSIDSLLFWPWKTQDQCHRCKKSRKGRNRLSAITPLQRLKTYLFNKSIPPDLSCFLVYF